MTAIMPFPASAAEAAGVENSPHSVTIRLDLSSLEAPVATAQVAGSFNGWNGSPLADSNGDDVWETTLMIPAGGHTYRFLVNGDIEEFVGTEPCTTDPGSGPVNRVLDVSEDEILPVVCWLECNSCGPGCSVESFCNYDPLEINEDGTACLTEGDACDDENPTTSGDAYTADCGCEGQPIEGCMDASACNYDPNAVIDADNCNYACPGCTDETACNYDSNAVVEDNSCEYAQANRECDGTCLNDVNGNGLCDEEEISGCMIPEACNYDEEATFDAANCDFDCVLCEATHDFGDASWGTSPDPTMGEALPMADLNQPYAASLQILMPTTLDQVMSQPFGLLVQQMEILGDGTLAGNTLTGVVFTDIATLEEFHADDLGLIVVPNNRGDDPNPNVLLPARQYCVGFQGTPNRLGVYRVSLDVIFTINAGGLVEFDYTIDAALTVQAFMPGCTDEEACNYDSEALDDDGSCLMLDECGVCGGPGIEAGACDCDGNELDALGACGGDCAQDADANGICDDAEILGCTILIACNYNAQATQDDGSCDFTSCLSFGCTDATACNYDANADFDNGTCADLDECGVCGGPGAILACGCADIPAGDCDCDGNQLDALGVCGGACLADVNCNGICDDEDDCTDTTACNYDDPANESCAVADCAGVCGGENTCFCWNDFAAELIDFEVQCPEYLPQECDSTYGLDFDVSCTYNNELEYFCASSLSHDCSDGFFEGTYAVVDVSAGTSVYLTQRVEVNDTSAPIFDHAEAEFDYEIGLNDAPTVNCQLSLPLPCLNIVDNCDCFNPWYPGCSEPEFPSGTVSVTEVIDTLDGSPWLYSVQRIWTATDASGNSSTYHQAILIKDSLQAFEYFEDANANGICDFLEVKDVWIQAPAITTPRFRSMMGLVWYSMLSECVAEAAWKMTTTTEFVTIRRSLVAVMSWRKTSVHLSLAMTDPASFLVRGR